MSTLLSAEISATCSALGYFDEKTNKYYADSNILETVKDLIRYLRRDDEIYTARRQLGETKVLITDLMPLLTSYHEESDLFDILLRLIMNLTTPPLLLFDSEVPTDITIRNYYLELEDNLKYYKEAFVDEKIWAVFSTHISKILDIDNAERGDENGVKIERVLVLIRNVLFVPTDSMEKRPDNDASVHDQVLWALHHSGLLDIILYITTSPSEHVYYMYILEIMFFLLKGQHPKELANAALQRSQGEKVRDEAELINIRHTESNERQKKMKIYMGARHSRFGGTFVVKNMKSINDNELISHRPLNKLDSLNFDVNKRKRKTPKNRSPIVNSTVDRRSAFAIRLFLKEFCIEFLNGSYNSMMQHIKNVLVRSNGDKHDESYYLWALSFFMAFNRYYKFEVKLVSESLSVQTFYYVQQQSENYLDLISKDRKKFLIWSKRLHTALLSYKELLSTLFVMDKSTDQLVKESSKVIKSNIFYIPEYREFILSLLIMFDELKMSNCYLKDLMETQHLFMKMLEHYCKVEGSVVVKKKSKSKRKKVSNKNKNTKELDLNEMWDNASPQLSVILETKEQFLSVVPFDVASDIPIDEQKSDAMKNIQKKLRHSEYESAIGMMRAAREVWPENNSFGNDNMTPEEEFLSLRDIFFADFGENVVENLNPVEECYSDNYNDDDNEEDCDDARDTEVNFNFDDILHRLPHPKIVKTCSIALKYFETNSVNANQSILKLMHRIAFDCKCYVMFFQLSLFRTFQNIFKLKDLPQYRELVKFAIYIIRQFFGVTQTNDKVFIEALFWTHKKEAYEIENGYGSIEATSALAKLWSEEEENELRVLFEEHKNKQIDEDIVDWILKNLVNHTRSRRMVLRKLKELDLLEDYKKGGKSKGMNMLYWSTQEETQLRELYAEFKDSADPLGSIINGLTVSRPRKKIIDKMLTLGLIKDEKEIKKKKKITTQKKISSNRRNVIYSDSESDESTNAPVNPKLNQKKKIKTSYPVTADKKVINKIILDNINAGRQDAVEWLKESIFDVIEDYEENHEGIPIVPLTDFAVDAMEKKEFQKLLLSLGFTEPFDEQESFWRVPGNMSIDILKSHHDLIISVLENNFVEDTELNENLNDSSQNCPRFLQDPEETTVDDIEIENAELGENSDIDSNKDISAKENVNNTVNDIEIENAELDENSQIDSNKEMSAKVNVNNTVDVDDIEVENAELDKNSDIQNNKDISTKEKVNSNEETNGNKNVMKRNRSIPELDNPPIKRTKTDNN